MHFMPLGHFFGAMWFGLLFLAAVTSSLSMLQPAIAFLEGRLRAQTPLQRLDPGLYHDDRCGADDLLQQESARARLY